MPSLPSISPLTCIRDWVISRVEAIIERLVDGLLEEGKELSITLKTRAGTCHRKKGSAGNQRDLLPAKSRRINFPGGSAQEAWRFS
jgi:meiotic recombination protein SPO11